MQLNCFFSDTKYNVKIHAPTHKLITSYREIEQHHMLPKLLEANKQRYLAMLFILERLK